MPHVLPFLFLFAISASHAASLSQEESHQKMVALLVEGGQRRSLYRWVGSGGSFGGNPLRQYMGLASAKRVAQLVVFWPKSDKEQVFDNVPVNAIIRVTEGREQLEILALPSFKFAVEHPKRAEHHLQK